MTLEEAEALWETYMESFQGYGFNRGHATSYGILAVRAAYLKCHHPQEYFVSLLDTYPEKHKYVAAAKEEGFRLLPPDINRSSPGFSKGPDDKSILVGLSRIDKVGPKATEAIMRGQPFSSVDDLRERTPGQAVKSTTISNLAAVGAFKSFGIKPTGDDNELFQLLGFLTDKPKAIQALGDAKIKHAGRRENEDGSWKHAGLERGVGITEFRTSVSKLFWIPDFGEEGNAKKLLKKKASAWARVKTWLLLCVDENGIPFHLLANEDKPELVAYLDWIVKHHIGSVLCCDGGIRKPFDTDGPMGFRFNDITGAFNGEPQVWNPNVDDKYIDAFVVLHKRKRNAKKGG